MDDVLCPFQHYFSHITATAHIIYVFPGFHQDKTEALRCLTNGHSSVKTQTIQCGSNLDSMDKPVKQFTTEPHETPDHKKNFDCFCL